MEVIEALKLEIAKKEQEAQNSAENMREGELKKVKLKVAKDEREQCKAAGEENDHKVYVTSSRKLQIFKGIPLNRGSDPWIEEWIEDAKTICERRGLAREQTASFLLAHFAEKANKRFWLRKTKSKLTLNRC